MFNLECLTVEGLWNKVSHNKTVHEDFKTKEEFKVKIIDRWMITGAVKKGRAVDKPEIKSSGYEVNVRKAYKHKLPYTVASLTPLPPLLRDDYIAHLFIYHKYKAYDIFPQDVYPFLDEINLQVVKFMDSSVVELSSLFGKSEEEKIMEMENITDPVIKGLIEERLLVSKRFMEKNNPKYKNSKQFEEHYKRLGHEYYINTLSQMRRGINEAIIS
jgi:hypothetical protein